MRNKIITAVGIKNENRHSFVETKEIDNWIVDWKKENNGDVKLHHILPHKLNSQELMSGVYIENREKVLITVDLFRDNALPISRGHYSKQCECIVYPSNLSLEGWILFIEMKYVEGSEQIFDDRNAYPSTMKKQIVETVKYFRDRDVIPAEKKVFSIVSFPTVIADTYSGFIYNFDEIIELFLSEKILLRVTDKVIVLSDTDILLGS